MVIALPYQHRRFEFKLGASEVEEDVTREDQVAERLVHLLPGLADARDRSQPGLYAPLPRAAESFQSGRVFLAGDAAHLQPPFFGQGMNSGIRDVTNLAWKLAAVISAKVDASVLESYDVERRKHATAMVSFATRIGRLYSPRNRLTEIGRDSLFRVISRMPGARDYILQMKYKPMPNYVGGLVLDPPVKGSVVGRMVPQPWVENTRREHAKRLDDVLGGWFCGRWGSIATRSIASATRDGRCGSGWELGSSRSGSRGMSHSGTGRDRSRTDRRCEGASSSGSTSVVDVDGVFAEMSLARPNEEVLVVRPDRYVMAACRADELDEVTRHCSHARIGRLTPASKRRLGQRRQRSADAARMGRGKALGEARWRIRWSRTSQDVLGD